MPDHRTNLAKAVRQAGRSAELHYKAQNPDADRLKVHATLGVYVPRSKEMKDLPAKAVARFLGDPASLEMSNAELVKELAKGVGRPVPVNILTEPFSALGRKKAYEHLELKGVTLDLDKHDTPSKVKRALKALKAGTSADVAYEVKISFSDNVVAVNDLAFPIQKGRRIHIGKKKLNVDVLQELLRITQ